MIYRATVSLVLSSLMNGVVVPCRLHSAVTPWLDIPYQEQLVKKSNAMKEVLRKMAYAITKKCSHPVSAIVKDLITSVMLYRFLGGVV